MKVKKLITIIMSLILLTSCNNNQPSSSSIVNEEAVTPYKVEVSTSGKAYLKEDGTDNVYIMKAAHIRSDLLIRADSLTVKEMEPYFKIAKETNLNTLEVPITWSQLELEKGVYDFSDVKDYLDLAKKYELKINFIWYGSFTDGESRTANYPAYISENPRVYKVIKDLLDFGVNGRVRVLKWDDPDLLNREYKVLNKMMNYIGEWNQENDSYNPVIMVQLGQGAGDRFIKWRIAQYDVRGQDGLLMSNDEASVMVYKYLEVMAKAVKDSNYKALTRVEFCEQNAVTNMVVDIKNIPNIDIVSPTYLHEVSNTKTGILSFSEDERLGNMFVMNSENWAADNNYRNTLSTFALGGGGYSAYYLSSPIYYPESPNGALYGRYDVENDKFEQRNTRVTDTKKILDILTNAQHAVATINPQGFVVLGMNNLLSVGEVQKSYATYKVDEETKGIAFEYEIKDPKGLGYVIVEDKYIYVCSTVDSKITFRKAQLLTASKGRQNSDGTWISDGTVTFGDNNTSLVLEAMVTYRIRTNEVETASNKWFLENGYLNYRESLRG